MDRIILGLTLLLLLPSSANALPIVNRYFKLIPETEAHYQSGAAKFRYLDSKSIRAFVWNIKKTEEPCWRKEFEGYGKDKDIILVQEGYQNELYNQTTEGFEGFRWDFGASFLYTKYNNTATGTAIGSNVDPSEVIVKHSVDMEPVVGTPKSMTFAKYPLSDSTEELLVISIHGINITSFGSFKRQLAQAEEQINAHNGPVLFAGDFNTRTKSRTAYLFELMNKLKLKAVNFKNANYRMAWKFTRNYLDHGFIRGLTVKNAEVLKDSTGSDHKPMMLELALEEAN